MWFLLSLLTAGSESSKDIFFSQPRLKVFSPLLRAWVITAASLPVLVAVLAFTGIPAIRPVFWIYVTIQALLMCVAHVLYMRALTLGPLSQTQPILALTTVFLALTNPLMTNDHVTAIGWVGVILVGVGIYGTQHPGRDPVTGTVGGFFSPFVEMMRQPGVMSKLGVAVIFSVTSNLDRLALEASSGPFYLVVDSAIIATVLGLVLLVQRARRTNDVRQRLPLGLFATGGSIHALTILLQVWAYTLAAVPYVIAVKRFSILFTSLWGYFVRKERAPHWYRLAGVALVLAGVALILIYGKA